MLFTEARHRARWLTGCLMVAALVAAGCGSDDDSNSDTGSGAAAATTAAPAATTEAAATTEEAAGATGVPSTTELATTESFESDPPTEGPAIAKGKSVWWVSCGMSIPDCATPANAAKEAAAKAGLKFNIADGKLNVGGGDAVAVRTALAAKPDLIIIHGIGCPLIRQPLLEAKKAGVKVMGVEALDCSDPPTNGKDDLFTADMNYSEKAQSSVDYFSAWGKLDADYIIAETGGKTNYIVNEGQEPLQKLIGIAFDQEMKDKCPDCKQVEKLTFTSADLIPNGPWIQELRATLTKNIGKYDVVQMPFDVNLLVGGAKAVKDGGTKAKLIGGNGSVASFALIRNGQVLAIPAAHSLDWMGYGAIDNANRVLQDQPTVPQGVGFRPVNKDNNLPPAGKGYESPIDWRAAYAKMWGAAK